MTSGTPIKYQHQMYFFNVHRFMARLTTDGLDYYSAEIYFFVEYSSPWWLASLVKSSRTSVVWLVLLSHSRMYLLVKKGFAWWTECWRRSQVGRNPIPRRTICQKLVSQLEDELCRSSEPCQCWSCDLSQGIWRWHWIFGIQRKDQWSEVNLLQIRWKSCFE